ncbi:MAG: DUF4919 domain-containing protein [Bacteroidaceae bacterium]|nr:DUF4919 domain-containing protein [Bacteroidaceae bacterium]
MRKTTLTILMFLITVLSLHAQNKVDLDIIKEIVQNEKGYYNDILNVYLTDDPYIRIDDIALIYYGQAYLPTYKGGNDANEEMLKTYVSESNQRKVYNTAKKILEYNPVSLNALFYAWRSAEALGLTEAEATSYVKKYLSLLEMIITTNDGKSSKTAFKVISPDDQDHILYGILDIEEVKSRDLDTQTLCNIIRVEPSEKFKSRTMYIDVSLPLSHIEK